MVGETVRKSPCNYFKVVYKYIVAGSAYIEQNSRNIDVNIKDLLNNNK